MSWARVAAEAAEWEPVAAETEDAVEGLGWAWDRALAEATALLKMEILLKFKSFFLSCHNFQEYNNLFQKRYISRKKNNETFEQTSLFYQS